MNLSSLYSVLSILLLIHLVLSFYTTKEILELPIYTKSKKTLWVIIIWLVPLFGIMSARNKLELEKTNITSNSKSSVNGHGISSYGSNENE